MYDVSIHALLAECDNTLPDGPLLPPSFNPRTPCGVRHQTVAHTGIFAGFQSTHSLRSATFCEEMGLPMYDVSIHALLAECDNTLPDGPLLPPSFNPRTPCGVRPEYSRVPSPVPRFQSTHSLRSATRNGAGVCNRFDVSIHALLAECDHAKRFLANCGVSFNPRTPCGVRQPTLRNIPFPLQFQSTHSLRSATRFHNNFL